MSKIILSTIAKNVGLLRFSNLRLMRTPYVIFSNTFLSQHEPEYLKLLKPKIPIYPLLNVQMKAYDFVPLERYARYVHNIALNMGIEVENAWATPHTSKHIVTYKPRSTAVESEYDLKLHERNVQLSNVSSTIIPIFIDVIQSSLPEGVDLSVHPHEKEHEEIRYIPDLELKDLKEQLEEMTSPKEGTKK